MNEYLLPFPFFEVVSIDLLDLSCNPGSKKYERVSWSFREKKPLKFDFLLAWHHTGRKTTPRKRLWTLIIGE